MWKNPAQNARRGKFAWSGHRTRSRKWFAGMLWRAFPAESERGVAQRAAPVLDVSERQVINWLRCDHDAALSYVTAVLVIAGAETVLGPDSGRAA